MHQKSLPAHVCRLGIRVAFHMVSLSPALKDMEYKLDYFLVLPQSFAPISAKLSSKVSESSSKAASLGSTSNLDYILFTLTKKSAASSLVGYMEDKAATDQKAIDKPQKTDDTKKKDEDGDNLESKSDLDADSENSTDETAEGNNSNDSLDFPSHFKATLKKADLLL